MKTFTTQAIKLAIENDFWPKRVKTHYQIIDFTNEGETGFHPQDKDTPYASVLWEEMWFDPAFWQCLGKGLGWGSFYDDEGMPRISVQGWYPDTHIFSSGTDESMWQAYIHRFIDTLIEGKSAEDFFKGVIGKKI